MLDGILDFVISTFGDKMEKNIRNRDIKKVKKTVLLVLLTLGFLILYLIIAALGSK